MSNLNCEQLHKLFKKNQGLVYSIWNKHFSGLPSNVSLKDDILQEGFLSLWKACLKYNPDKAKFSTFAYWTIYKSMLSFAQRTYQKTCKTVSLYAPVMISESEDTVSYEDILSEDGMSDEICLKNDLCSILKSSPQSNTRIIYMSYLGYTQEEIANTVGMTQGNVSKIIRSIKEKLQQED